MGLKKERKEKKLNFPDLSKLQQVKPGADAGARRSKKGLCTNYSLKGLTFKENEIASFFIFLSDFLFGKSGG